MSGIAKTRHPYSVRKQAPPLTSSAGPPSMRSAATQCPPDG